MTHNRFYRLFGFFLFFVIFLLTWSGLSAQVYRWRRTAAVVNSQNDPLKLTRDEERFKDWIKTWQVQEGRFVVRLRDQDRDYVACDVTMTATFKSPPVVLNSGERVNLEATLTGSGQVTGGRPGMIFNYTSRDVSFEGEATVTGGFEDSRFKGDTIRPSFIAPKARQGAEFKIYAGLWNEPPCNVIWTYRAEPMPAVDERVEGIEEEISPGSWGELTGHLVATRGEVVVVRAGQYIKAWKGMPIFTGDLIVTSENAGARLSAFQVDAKDAWETTLGRLRRSGEYSVWEQELGPDWHTRIPIPQPTRENISDFIQSLPEGSLGKLSDSYLETIKTLGDTHDIGGNTEIGVSELEGGILSYLKRGIIRIWKSSVTSNRSPSTPKAAVVIASAPSESVQSQSIPRWSQLDLSEQELYREAVERDRQRYGQSWSGFWGGAPRPAYLLRPKGTDFAVEYTPSSDRFVFGVQEGEVECLDFRSSRTVSLRGGEVIQVVQGQGGDVLPMAANDWQKAISMTVLPEEAEVAGETGGVAVPFLNGRVKSIRLFESGQDLTAYGQRNYQEKFTATQTRYICWELEISYPQPDRQIDFTIEAKYYSSEGTLLAHQNHETYIVPEWTSSAHALGWGEEQSGYWKPGLYRVEISLQGQVLGSKSFEVFGDQAIGTYGDIISRSEGIVPVIQGKVTSLKFFESPFNAPPVNERIFTNRFVRTNTRYINWNVFFEYPAPGRRVDFEIEAVWYRPDGTVLTRQRTPTYAEPNWTNSNCNNGWGSEIAGNYPAGIYRVELYVDGSQIAKGYFEIIQ